MRIINPEAGASAFQLEPVHDSAQPGIKGYTIPALVATIPKGSLFIVKIDIEGGQKFLFAENTDWIDEVHLIVIEIDDWQFPWQATARCAKCSTDFST